MTKAKYIIMILFASIILLIAPNIVNAEEQTYKDNEQDIEWAYEVDESDNVINLRLKTKDKAGKVTIPEKIEDKTVISLSEASGYKGGAFENCTGITEVTIPNTIKTIGNDAFKKCTGLKTIVIPDSVTQIGSSAFSYCSGLTSVTFSQKLSSIGSSAFEYCSGITKITIPDSVTTIGSSAFDNCTSIKELTLSNNITKIDSRTFYKCSGLTSVVIPSGVNTIVSTGVAEGAFGDCKNLTKILIPDTVTTIGEYAFYNCSKLTIYGNDDMTSKEYAEEHKIPFDYIKNWDKTSSGSDITAPKIESIQVTKESVNNYTKDTNRNMYIVPTGTNLVINVVFNEDIKGTEVPTLTIKFGNGKNIQLTEGTVAGSTVIYTYTVKSTDKGVMTTVDYKGGNIQDIAGNVATLSCPALEVQYDSQYFVYANGDATNPNNSGNNGGTTNEGTNNGGTNNSSSNNGSSDNGGTTDGSDKTVATGKIPQTGVSMVVGISIVIVLIVLVLIYKKNQNYKDIK